MYTVAVRFRSLLVQNLLRFASRSRVPVGKIVTVLFFSVCWAIVLIVRSRYAGDETQLDATWLISLAATAQQGLISGRDFHFTYGPLAQLLAWFATLATTSNNAFDAYAVISYVFCASSIVLVGLSLLCLTELGAKETAFVYVCCASLNLFFESSSYRMAALLFAAVCLHRCFRYSKRPQYHWAIIAGLVTFLAQLITVELGAYIVLSALIGFGLVTVAGGLMPGKALAITGSSIKLALIYGIVIAALNVALNTAYFLTGDSYDRFFDYHVYAIEMMRGYSNGMTLGWQLEAGPTVGLGLVAVFCIVVSAIDLKKGLSTRLDSTRLDSTRLDSTRL